MENRNNTEQNRRETKNKEWTSEEMFLLIDLYKEKPRLWDPTHKEYKLKSKRLDDWNEVSSILNCDVTDIKKKIESLLTSFRRERQRCEATKKSGVESDDIYKSKWFAFEKMKFLLDKFTPHVTLDTMDTVNDSLEVSVEDNTDNSDLNNPTPGTSKAFKSPKKLKLDKNIMLNKRAEEAYNNMQQALKRRNERDSSTTFGEHVTNKHRTYSSRTKSMVEHLIANILFEADMGRYESNYGFDVALTHSPISSESPEQYFRTSSPAHEPPSRSTTPTVRNSQQPYFRTSSPTQTESLPLQQYNRECLVENLKSRNDSNSGSCSSGSGSKITLLRSILIRPPSSSPQNISPKEQMIPPEEHNIILPEEENHPSPISNTEEHNTDDSNNFSYCINNYNP